MQVRFLHKQLKSLSHLIMKTMSNGPTQRKTHGWNLTTPELASLSTANLKMKHLEVKDKIQVFMHLQIPTVNQHTC